MFTINIYLKFAIIAAGFLIGILFWALWGFWYGFPFLLIGIIALASYLLLGTIQSASELMQMQDFAGAKQRLGLTYFPKLLYVTNRAMYYILHGSIDAQAGSNKTAENYFQKALSLKLPSDNEKAMVYLQLANINATKNNWQGAQTYIAKTKKLNVTMGQIKDQLDMFDKAMKQRGQAKVAQQMGGGKRGGNMMRGGSSKRRRPKMR